MKKGGEDQFEDEGGRRVVLCRSLVRTDSFSKQKISKEEEQFMQLKLEDLGRCTGFPVQTPRDFVDRGLLPTAKAEGKSATYDGLSLLRHLQEVNRARLVRC